MTSRPFRLTVEEWARDASIPVTEARENIDVLTAKGWIIPVAPDMWILTVPGKAAGK
jgi:hypothetical protein